MPSASSYDAICVAIYQPKLCWQRIERAFKDLYFSFSCLGAISQIPQLTQAGSWLDFGRWISQTENIHLIGISKSPTITRIWIEKLFYISNKEKRNFAGIWEITEGRLWSIIFKEKDKWRGRERQESVLILMENFASPIFIRSSKELEISLFSNNFAQVFATHIFSLAIHIEIQKSNSEIVLGILFNRDISGKCGQIRFIFFFLTDVLNSLRGFQDNLGMSINFGICNILSSR